jgi:hypothetical protein
MLIFTFILPSMKESMYAKKNEEIQSIMENESEIEHFSVTVSGVLKFLNSTIESISSIAVMAESVNNNPEGRNPVLLFLDTMRIVFYNPDTPINRKAA